ncbi:MAG TPA: type VI secretion system baseplate subunit TssE [Burkholderiaceae bacterium]|nr:type VI secretion system baseplate subunit TssE [Burkholderiaceae bacterium]
MSLPKPQDRLQPALLDRLTDDDPDANVESPERAVMSRVRLRQAVLRDLSWLFNTTRLGDSVPLEGCPHVKRSVLNFGLPALSGQTASGVDIVALEQQVRQAIIDNEPRILASTLSVEALMNDNLMDRHNQISFRITGQLWSQPVPLELLLHTDIDLETGRVEVKELSR